MSEKPFNPFQINDNLKKKQWDQADIFKVQNNQSNVQKKSEVQNIFNNNDSENNQFSGNILSPQQPVNQPNNQKKEQRQQRIQPINPPQPMIARPLLQNSNIFRAPLHQQINIPQQPQLVQNKPTQLKMQFSIRYHCPESKTTFQQKGQLIQRIEGNSKKIIPQNMSQLNHNQKHQLKHEILNRFNKKQITQSIFTQYILEMNNQTILAHIGSKFIEKRHQLGFQFYESNVKFLLQKHIQSFGQYQIKGQPYENTVNILMKQLRINCVCAVYVINITFLSHIWISKGQLFEEAGMQVSKITKGDYQQLIKLLGYHHSLAIDKLNLVKILRIKFEQEGSGANVFKLKGVEGIIHTFFNLQQYDFFQDQKFFQLQKQNQFKSIKILGNIIQEITNFVQVYYQKSNLSQQVSRHLIDSVFNEAVDFLHSMQKKFQKWKDQLPIVKLRHKLQENRLNQNLTVLAEQIKRGEHINPSDMYKQYGSWKYIVEYLLVNIDQRYQQQHSIGQRTKTLINVIDNIKQISQITINSQWIDLFRWKIDCFSQRLKKVSSNKANIRIQVIQFILLVKCLEKLSNSLSGKTQTLESTQKFKKQLKELFNKLIQAFSICRPNFEIIILMLYNWSQQQKTKQQNSQKNITNIKPTSKKYLPSINRQYIFNALNNIINSKDYLNKSIESIQQTMDKQVFAQFYPDRIQKDYVYESCFKEYLAYGNNHQNAKDLVTYDKWNLKLILLQTLNIIFDQLLQEIKLCSIEQDLFNKIKFTINPLCPQNSHGIFLSSLGKVQKNKNQQNQNIQIKNQQLLRKFSKLFISKLINLLSKSESNKSQTTKSMQLAQRFLSRIHAIFSIFKQNVIFRSNQKKMQLAINQQQAITLYEKIINNELSTIQLIFQGYKISLLKKPLHNKSQLLPNLIQYLQLINSLYFESSSFLSTTKSIHAGNSGSQNQQIYTSSSSNIHYLKQTIKFMYLSKLCSSQTSTMNNIYSKTFPSDESQYMSQSVKLSQHLLTLTQLVYQKFIHPYLKLINIGMNFIRMMSQEKSIKDIDIVMKYLKNVYEREEITIGLNILIKNNNISKTQIYDSPNPSTKSINNKQFINSLIESQKLYQSLKSHINQKRTGNNQLNILSHDQINNQSNNQLDLKDLLRKRFQQQTLSFIVLKDAIKTLLLSAISQIESQLIKISDYISIKQVFEKTNRKHLFDQENVLQHIIIQRKQYYNFAKLMVCSKLLQSNKKQPNQSQLANSSSQQRQFLYQQEQKSLYTLLKSLTIENRVYLVQMITEDKWTTLCSHQIKYYQHQQLLNLLLKQKLKYNQLNTQLLAQYVKKAGITQEAINSSINTLFLQQQQSTSVNNVTDNNLFCRLTYILKTITKLFKNQYFIPLQQQKYDNKDQLYKIANYFNYFIFKNIKIFTIVNHFITSFHQQLSQLTNKFAYPQYLNQNQYPKIAKRLSTLDFIEMMDQIQQFCMLKSFLLDRAEQKLRSRPGQVFTFTQNQPQINKQKVIRLRKQVDYQRKLLKQTLRKTLQIIAVIPIQSLKDDNFHQYSMLMISFIQIGIKFVFQINTSLLFKAIKVLLQNDIDLLNIKRYALTSSLISQSSQLVKSQSHKYQSKRKNRIINQYIIDWRRFLSPGKQFNLFSFLLKFMDNTTTKFMMQLQIKCNKSKQNNKKSSLSQLYLSPEECYKIKELFILSRKVIEHYWLLQQNQTPITAAQQIKGIQKNIKQMSKCIGLVIEMIIRPIIKKIKTSSQSWWVYKTQTNTKQYLNVSQEITKWQQFLVILANGNNSNHHKSQQTTENKIPNSELNYYPTKLNFQYQIFSHISTQLQQSIMYIQQTISQAKYQIDQQSSRHLYQESKTQLYKPFHTYYQTHFITTQQLNKFRQLVVYLSQSINCKLAKFQNKEQFQIMFNQFRIGLIFLPQINLKISQNIENTQNTQNTQNTKNTQNINKSQNQSLNSYDNKKQSTSYSIKIENFDLSIKFLTSFTEFIKNHQQRYYIYHQHLFGPKSEVLFKQISKQFRTLFKNFDLLSQLSQSQKLQKITINSKQITIREYVFMANVKYITVVMDLFTQIFKIYCLDNFFDKPENLLLKRYNTGFFCQALLMRILASDCFEEIHNRIQMIRVQEPQFRKMGERLQESLIEKTPMVRLFELKIVYTSIHSLISTILSQTILIHKNFNQPLNTRDYRNYVFQNSVYDNLTLSHCVTQRVIVDSIKLIQYCNLDKQTQPFQQTKQNAEYKFSRIKSNFMIPTDMGRQKFEYNTKTIKNINKQVRNVSMFSMIEYWMELNFVRLFFKCFKLLNQEIYHAIPSNIRSVVIRNDKLVIRSEGLVDAFNAAYFINKPIYSQKQREKQIEMCKQIDEIKNQSIQELTICKFFENFHENIELHQIMLSHSGKISRQLVEKNCSEITERLRSVRHLRFLEM